jgi:hypothetical protein
MILFQDRTGDVQVIRMREDEFRTDNIGVLRQPDTGEKNPNWIWDLKGVEKYETSCLTPIERLCIIRMLDKFNNFGYRGPGTRQTRWREITGLPEATF